MLRENMTKDQEQILINAYRSDDFTILYDLIDQYNIPDLTRDLLVGTINESKACLDRISNLGLKLALYEILGKIFKEYL